MRVSGRLLLSCALLIGSTAALYGQRENRGFLDSGGDFLHRGHWITGGMFSYSTNECSDFRFAMLNNINSTGYTLKISPFFAYAIRDNVALGARMSYSRSLDKIHSAEIDSDDIDLGIDEYYRLKHQGSVAAVMRYYFPLDSEGRFAILNEVRLSGGYGEAKYFNGTGDELKGAYETTISGALTISPGMLAMVNRHVAVEVNVGVLGAQYSRTSTTRNQVTKGDRTVGVLNYRVNLLSFELGLSYYF